MVIFWEREAVSENWNRGCRKAAELKREYAGETITETVIVKCQMISEVF